jgi:hypothetical protein
MSVVPKTVTTDSVLVEQEPSRETRRRLRVSKTVPDGIDVKDTDGGAALGDPTSGRSWLPCLDMEEVFFSRSFRCLFHRGTVKASRDFYHNWTNSILQQVKRKFWKMQMHCSEFHE